MQPLGLQLMAVGTGFSLKKYYIKWMWNKMYVRSPLQMDSKGIREVEQAADKKAYTVQTKTLLPTFEEVLERH